MKDPMKLESEDVLIFAFDAFKKLSNLAAALTEAWSSQWTG